MIIREVVGEGTFATGRGDFHSAVHVQGHGTGLFARHAEVGGEGTEHRGQIPLVDRLHVSSEAIEGLSGELPGLGAALPYEVLYHLRETIRGRATFGLEHPEGAHGPVVEIVSGRTRGAEDEFVGRAFHHEVFRGHARRLLRVDVEGDTGQDGSGGRDGADVPAVLIREVIGERSFAAGRSDGHVAIDIQRHGTLFLAGHPEVGSESAKDSGKIPLVDGLHVSSEAIEGFPCKFPGLGAMLAHEVQYHLGQIVILDGYSAQIHRFLSAVGQGDRNGQRIFAGTRHLHGTHVLVQRTGAAGPVAQDRIGIADRHDGALRGNGDEGLVESGSEMVWGTVFTDAQAGGDIVRNVADDIHLDRKILLYILSA